MSAELAVLDPGIWLSLTTARVVADVARGCGLRFLLARVRTEDPIPADIEGARNFCEERTVSGPEQIDLLLGYATVATEDEAAAAALAQCFRLPLISDEPKLRRSFSSRTSGTSTLLSLPELLQRWEKRCPTQAPAVVAAVAALQADAFYLPSRTAPGFDWWASRCTPRAAAAP